MKLDTLCASELKDKITHRPHLSPIYANATFEFESVEQGIKVFAGEEEGMIYGRYGNPTIAQTARKIAALEGYNTPGNTSALMTSSGQAALSTLLFGLLNTGDKILTQGNLYGGSTELMQKSLTSKGIDTVFTQLRNLEEVEAILAKDDSIKLIFCETPSNPTLECVDLAAISTLAKKYNVYTAADNTFCTPYLQRPIEFGIDFVMHSTTKYLNGHGTGIGGVLISDHEDLMKGQIWNTMKIVGTNSSPFEAWLMNIGIKTLALRMERHCNTSMQLAEYLEDHDRIAKVNYPGLSSHPDYALASKQMAGYGGVVSFELEGGVDQGKAFMNALSLCKLAPSLGESSTLVMHPATSSHLKVSREMCLKNNITDGLVRVATGLEDASDIIADIEQAIGQAY